MNPLELLVILIDLFWTAREQRKTLERTKRALRQHARKVLNLDDTRDQSLWAKCQCGAITFDQRPPIKLTLRQRIANVPHAIRLPPTQATPGFPKAKLGLPVDGFFSIVVSSTTKYSGPEQISSFVGSSSITHAPHSDLCPFL
jgi:hypothetical protein